MVYKRHWTFRFLLNRISEFVYRRFHPDHPWLTPEAIRILDHGLIKSMAGMELGSGRSTIWIAQRVRQLTSVESDSSWFEIVNQKLQTLQLNHVTYIFAEVKPNESAEDSTYLKPLREAPSDYFDFVLVDGDYRAEAALLAISKIKKGGILIVDNANWFLPSSTHSPSSRDLNAGCINEKWQSFHDEVLPWKRKWTSNGVTDTVLFYKPA